MSSHIDLHHELAQVDGAGKSCIHASALYQKKESMTGMSGTQAACAGT